MVRIKKKKSIQPCSPNKERNPNTNRCILKCKDGFERNSEFKCRKSCVHPKVRFQLTGRCRNPPRTSTSTKRKKRQIKHCNTAIFCFIFILSEQSQTQSEHESLSHRSAHPESSR